MPASAASTREAKVAFLEAVGRGLSVRAALAEAGRSAETTYDRWKKDPEFAAELESIRRGLRLRKHPELAAPERDVDFVQFRERFMGSATFDHQKNIWDVIEGRQPRWMDSSFTYVAGDRRLALINVPPEHCAEVSTPILTRRGWLTVGDVVKGDELVGRDGQWWPVSDVWTPPGGEVDLFRVTFRNGSSVVTDAGHKWNLMRFDRTVVQATTGQLFEKPRPNKSQRWRIPTTPPVDGPDADLPLDPYLLGYWLGDGDKNGYRIACGEQDLDALRGQLDDTGFRFKVSSMRGGHEVYVYGMTPGLRAAGVLGNKRIPNSYFIGSYKQRLALLQGLMDSDGTITAKDGRARWVQMHRPELTRDVYRLVASLGYRPHHKVYGETEEVGFTPDEVPVFRLERKAARQKPKGPRAKINHTIASVERAGRGHVKCISVLSPDNLFAIGDSMILTHNAKTETFSIDYPTYRIATNPNIKILLVSKTLERAKEFVYGIQQRLTAPRWRDMQVTFAPGGFKTTDALWRADRFWLGQDLRDSTDKDPTVQALGMRGQIYGARSDLIIVDDAVTLDNASEFEKQIRWLQQEVMTRVGDGGQIVILGTRVDAKDLYSEIVDPTRYPIGVSPWTVLRMPAVLDGTGANPKSWRTLWPRSDRPWAGTSPEPGEDGMFPRWDGPTLNRRRGMIAPKTWAMVYQQQDIPDDGVFQPDLVAAAVNGKRRTGRFTGAVGHAHTSHAGLYVICGLDPAVGGDAGAVVMAVDRATKMRYVLDANVIHNPMPKDLHDLIRAWTDEYQPNEWRIEKNGLNKMLTQDESIRQFLANRGVPMFEHYTTKEVWDADFGVAGMAPLFGYKQDERDASGVHNRIEGRLIELPSTVGSEGVKALVEQLVTWAPQTKNKRDMVMALWFCEVKARELCRERKVSRVSYMPNEFLTPDRERGRVVVDMNDYMTARAAVERFA